MQVTPNCGPGGTFFRFLGSGFDVNEMVGVYVTDPTQAVYGAPFQAQPDAQGRVGVTFQTLRGFPAGVWAMTMEGVTSKRRAIGYFKITAEPATPTRPPSGGPPPCEAARNSRNGEARPVSATDGDIIVFTARGFRPGEDVSYWFTDPDGDVYGTPQAESDFVNPDGTIGPLEFPADLLTFLPGTWGLTFQGATSNHTAVIFFCIYE
jgi:hypothetical protein